MTLKIAALCTQYYPLSHADVIVTRWLEPHPHDAAVGFRPKSEIASLYIAQVPSGNVPPAPWFTIAPHGREERYDPSFDIGHLIAHHYGVPVFPTIREALTLGGPTLAVDAVLLIGEHGDYPLNALGQKLYPRKEFFDAVVAVFREAGRVVPLFVDKHLSWNPDWAHEMVATARELSIPLFAGSSAPITGPVQDLRLDGQPNINESLGLFFTGAETYGIHSIEFVQSFVEQRRGGENGIVALTTYRGDAVWTAHDAQVWSQTLFDAALTACTTAKAGDVRANCGASPLEPVAYVFEHADGHRQSHIMLDGHISEFAVGLVVHGHPLPRASTCDDLLENVFVINFAHMCRAIEGFVQTGVSPVPVERCLLTTLMIAAAMAALQRPGERIETPELRVSYRC